MNIFTFLFVILMVAWIFGWLLFHLGGRVDSPPSHRGSDFAHPTLCARGNSCA